MFLKELTIHNGDDLIRKIPFKKGINLIIDETNSSEKTESGNSVGKTTVLRLIDFCLDGKGDNIFTDPEFKDTNYKVEEFLKGNNIIIGLILIQDIDNEYSNKVKIERNFLTYGNKIQRINGEHFSNDDFSKELKEIIFRSNSKNPTFKQLKSKNIRDEKNKLNNTLRVLAPNVVTHAVYESLHLFWFGIDVDLSKDQLVRNKNIEENLQKRLRKDSNISQINQTLTILNIEIDKLQKKKDLFNLNEKYEEDISNLNLIKFKLNEISTTLSRLELRKELILESKADLEQDIPNIDVNQIRIMYEKAKSFMPSIQKTFEETVAFHNEMIHQKINFITEELPLVEREIVDTKNTLHYLLGKETELSKKIRKSGAIDDLDEIISNLNAYYEKKGHLEEQKRLWEKTISDLKEINSQLDEINENLYLKDDKIQTKITQFNSYFSEISSQLDGELSLLSADNSDGVYKFKITNIEGNPGTGSKKSQMASFDLAYIKFADKNNIPCLHFVLQDQIENVHSNQISNLLNEIVNGIKCQYVLPVLRDKLPLDIDIANMEIVSLSQSDKLFRLV